MFDNGFTQYLGREIFYIHFIISNIGAQNEYCVISDAKFLSSKRLRQLKAQIDRFIFMR